MTSRHKTLVAASPFAPDLPTKGDHRRLRDARRKARARSAEIEAARDAAVVETFRAELGSVVRSASPLLISMLAIEGLTLDDAVALLQPLAGWPFRPRLSTPKGARPFHTHMSRHYVAGLPPTQISEFPLIGRRFHRADGGYIQLEVVDHSLELEAQVGPVYMRTRFGELRIEPDFELPQTLFTACLGRLIEEIVDCQVWRGRGWRIVGTEEGFVLCGQTLVVAMGSTPYRMPWAR